VNAGRRRFAIRRFGRLRSFSGVLRPTGAVLIGIAVGELLCGVVGGSLELFTRPELGRATSAAASCVASAVITGLVGAVALVQARRYGDAASSLTRREAVLAVALIWVGAGVFGGLPFVLGAGMGPADAFFEAVSGLTTTGATVIVDIDGDWDASVGQRVGGLDMAILLWRSLIQWLGGMGIVVLFVAVFPTVGAGAKHMFKGEVPGTSAEGLTPRIAETSFTLWRLYAAFTLAECLILIGLGMAPFEAVCHAFTTMSTGGFSTRDGSIADFDSPAIEYVIGTFMLLGSVNYGLYYALLRGRSWRQVLRNTELRAFLAICALITIVLTLGIAEANHGGDYVEAFRYAYFMVGTTMSSTGYGTDDYMAYPTPILFFVILMMFIGGCSGSTAGGIKVERVVLMAKMSWAEFRKSFRPNVVQLVRMGRTSVPTDILMDVAVFVGVYFASLALGVLLAATTESVDLPAAFGATLTCLSNMGPAPFHPVDDNFAAYSSFAKVYFAWLMLLGRLEFFTLLALFVPDFWRR
jgi:trk system potassium uptake protein TrkH